MATKYRLTLDHIQKPNNAWKLERDGFTKSDIHNVLHREMNGARPDEQRKVISNLYLREKD